MTGAAFTAPAPSAVAPRPEPGSETPPISEPPRHLVRESCASKSPGSCDRPVAQACRHRRQRDATGQQMRVVRVPQRVNAIAFRLLEPPERQRWHPGSQFLGLAVSHRVDRGRPRCNFTPKTPEPEAACSGMAPQVRIAWRELHRPLRIGNPNA